MGTYSSKSLSPDSTSSKSKTLEQDDLSCETTTPVDEYIEAVVCNAADLKENQMKSLKIRPGGAKVLVIKQDGVITAIGSKCTHKGAPLANGVLGKGTVRCPWHGAHFNVKTGDIEDFPGLDSLPCYEVNVAEDGSVKVRAKKSDLKSNRRVKSS